MLDHNKIGFRKSESVTLTAEEQKELGSKYGQSAIDTYMFNPQRLPGHRPENAMYESYHGKYGRRNISQSYKILKNEVGNSANTEIKLTIWLIIMPDLIYSVIMSLYFGIHIRGIHLEAMDDLIQVHNSFYAVAMFNWCFYVEAMIALILLLISIKCEAINFFRSIFRYLYALPQIIGLINGWVFAYYCLSKDVQKLLLEEQDPVDKYHRVFKELYIMAWFRLSFPIFKVFLLIIFITCRFCPCCKEKSFDPEPEAESQM